jgi:hypothetical protein
MAEKGKTRTLKEHIHHEAKLNIVINLVLNTAIPIVMLRGLTEVSAWGDHGYGYDLLITAFILCSLLGAIFIAVTRRKHQRGEIIAEGHEGQALAWLIPYNPWLAAPWIGVIGVCLAVPPLILLLTVTGASTLSPLSYAVIKGVWAAALAAVVVSISIRQAVRKQESV